MVSDLVGMRRIDMRSPGQRAPVGLRSEPTNFLLIKLFLPGLAALAFATSVAGDWRALLLTWWLPLLAGFGATVAELKAEGGALYYRRALAWRRLEYSQVLACRRSWFPHISALEPLRGRSRWGRIYFVAAARFGPDPLAAYIAARAAGEPATAPPPRTPHALPARLRRCALALGGGVAYSALMATLFPGLAAYGMRTEAQLARGNPAGLARWLLLAQRGETLLVTWPYVAILAAALALFIGLRRCGQGAMSAAFILGVVLSWPVLARPLAAAPAARTPGSHVAH